jgi:Domain of unknown function (DUF4157)
MRTYAQKHQQSQLGKSGDLARPSLAARSHEGHPILHLQRTIGNQVVRRMLETRAEELERASTSTAASHFSPVHAPAAGSIQTKLAVNTPGDIYEQEADSVAERVMATPLAPHVQSQTEKEKPIQRKTTNDAEVQTAPTIVDQVLRSPGQPLDAPTRTFMEPRFGRDLSRITVHSNSEAANSAQAVQAQAYTVGSHIVFGAQQYAPQSDSGRHLIAHELTHVLQQGSQRPHLQRKPAAKPAAPPPAGGNILYIGLHNFKLELAALNKLYKGKPVNVTQVTLATDEAHTVSNAKTFDLTNDAGVDSFATNLGLSTADTKSAADLIKKALQMSDRDDMAHVMAEYAKTELDGQDRMSRVVLSGHSFGTQITNDVFKANNSHIYFSFLVDLAKLFPKAAAQTKHLYVSACYTGVEDNIRDFYQKAFPNLVTFSGWTGSCPTNTGAASTLSEWAKATDVDPTTLAKPPAGRSTWASGFYQGNEQSDPAETMKNLRADEAKFMDYFNGVKVDPDPHRGWLTNYYGQARTADLRVAAIKGADHDYAHLHAEQAVRLRFWTDQVAKFWKNNEATIRAGYGTATVRNFGKMSRKEALKAIANFPTEAKGNAADQSETQRLLDALKNLDEKVLPG